MNMDRSEQPGGHPHGRPVFCWLALLGKYPYDFHKT